jgi:hypothetical protein
MSTLSMVIAIGVPVVRSVPLASSGKTPDSMRTVSGSRRWVV